ncbi:TonB-dependent receptor [Niveispirillum lacus]|uniref:TonB-dependent receptor n=1 Tax=Niveispirillum lacus TaxID=1981099 RepID=A0A255YXY8_9PROT|nr:TonB-dependent receptor [Niveispirillum lacus]OYQ33564.1 TonB-dependent receptor [Niveispirillum lacus]
MFSHTSGRIRPGRHPLALSILLCSAAAIAMPAQGQQAPAPSSGAMLEEIIVSARKRDETLKDVPFSINAMSADSMKDAGATNIEDVSRNIVGLSIQNLGPGQSQVAIRGISAGQIVRDQPGVKEQVGVYLDESVISLSLFTPDLDLYDLSRVEVLRGPQGTLYGSGSLSGTIRYITNKPAQGTQEGTTELSVEQIDGGGTGYSAKAMINVPVSDTLTLRAVGYGTRYAGFIDAVQPNGSIKKDVNDGFRTGFRMALGWQPTENVTVTPRVVYQEIEADGFNREDQFNILANELVTTGSRLFQFKERQQFTQLEEQFKDQFMLADLTIEADLGAVTATSVTSITDRDLLVYRDASQLTGSITGQPGVLSPTGLSRQVYTLDSPLSDATDVKVFTQEGRLASNGDGPFQWVAGAFYSKIERKYGQTLNVDGFEAITGIDTNGARAQNGLDELYWSRIPYDFKQVALFGEGSYDLTEQLSATLGLRYFDFKENRTLNFDGIFADRAQGVEGKTSSDGFSPRAILSYDATEDVTINAQVSKGFRLGGINDPLNLPLCSATDRTTFGGRDSFGNESVWNYEMGAKVSFAGGRGALNIAGYYTDISNLQVTLDAGTCSSRIIFNADARTRGTEAEFSYQLTDALNLSLSGSFNDSEFTETVTSRGATGAATVVGGIKKGNRLPTVPRYQFSAQTKWEDEIGADLLGFATATFQHIGSRFTQAVDQDPSAVGTVTRIPIGGQPSTTFTFNPKLPSYSSVNLRMGVKKDEWEIAGYVNNLFDENAKLSLDRERGFRARVAYQVAKPRTFGAQVSTTF